ncbi:nitroreductase family protein [Belliella marina]|uniref:Nitroreductase family protein n=1 Tax=Belliella marina TaxID=1644146 RepID=A0ABW4VNE1_9BACT
MMMENEFEELVKNRWSPRAFSDKEITKDEMSSIFNAGKQVATSYNEQPWKFLLVQKGEESYKKLLHCLDDFNRKWAGEAPYLGIALSKRNFDGNLKENPHYTYDTGAFMAVASLAAFDLGIFIHQMAGFSEQKVQEQFAIPERYRPITLFAMGRHGKTEDLPEEIKKKESAHSSRKKLQEFLFRDQWDNPF